MSAESHQHQQHRMRLQPSAGTAATMMGGSGGGGGGVIRCIPAIVPPQAVSDRSILDSVAGFISDVTLQSQTPLGDAKDHILWVRFESTADISDPSLGDDWELEGGIAPPLLLILGYVTGVQVWIVPANGEAIEVLSWRHGSVKCLRVLPTPNSSVFESSLPDPYTHKRPLIALCDSAGAGFTSMPGAPGGGGGGGGGSVGAGAATGNASQSYTAVNFISLKDGETVRSIKFKSPIVDILANRASIVVTFAERIAVFDARTLDDRLTVTTCHPSPGINPNPVALGPRWIAYAERRLIPSKRSSGGCEGDGVTSYTATMLNAAKSLGKGLRELGEQVAAGLTGGHSSSSTSSSSLGAGGSTAVGGSGSGSGGPMGSLGGHGHHVGSAGCDAGAGTMPLGIGGVMVMGGGVGGGNDGHQQAGVVTVLDIKYPIKDISPTTGTPIASNGNDPIVAHFVAHSEALVALAFDAPGMLLLTADRRGHDFHVFRLHPHPSGASLAAVHHLYVLHRGDTTAKVQDVAFSLDSRWVAVSTLRGTTHVFPVTPYGGQAGVRTHGSPHVVNRLSRFHRSAGLSIDAMRSSSPVSHALGGGGGGAGGSGGGGGGGDGGPFAHHTPTATAYANPRTPPFPHPTTVQPLAQLRQPATLASTGGGGVGRGGGGGGGGDGGVGSSGKGSSGIHGLHHHHHRQRNSSSSSSDDPSVKPLRVCATFAKARSWLLDPPGCAMRDTPAHRIQRKPVDSLFILAAHGALIQYDLEPKHASGTPKEKICDDTPIELEVEPKAQWCLQRQEIGLATGGDLQPPLSLDNWLIRDRLLEEGLGGSGVGAGGGGSEGVGIGVGGGGSLDYDRLHHHPHPHQHRGSTGSIHIGGDHDDRWLSQVEIITHAGPHRRLWMGPQFMFKTYNTPSGSPLSSIDTDAVEVCTSSVAGGAGGGVGAPGTTTVAGRPARSNPMNMPLVGGGCCEHSPRLMNMNEFRHHENLDTEFSSLGPVESQLREDLADAMRESPLTTGRDATGSSAAGPPHQPAHHHHHHYHHHHQQQQQQTQLMSSSNSATGATATPGTGLSSVSSCSSTSIYSSTHSLSSICDQQLQQLQAQQCPPQSEQPQQQGRGGHPYHHHHHHQQQQQQQLYQEGVSSRPNSAASGRNVLPAGITIAKVVNPLGTVTTISTTASAAAAGGTIGGCSATGPDSLESDEFMQECDEEAYLHENCDEALFRPVVTVHAAGLTVHEVADRRAVSRYRGSSLDRVGACALDDVSSVVGEVDYDKRPVSQPASLIGRDLIVPVIEEKNLPLRTNASTNSKQQQQQQQRHNKTTTSLGASVEAASTSNRSKKPQQAPTVVVEEATKSKDCGGVRTKSHERSSRGRPEKGGTGGDWIPVETGSGPDSAHTGGGNSKRSGMSCVSEEFVNVELPPVTGGESEPKDIIPKAAGMRRDMVAVPATEKGAGSERTKSRKDGVGTGGTTSRHTEEGRGGARNNGKWSGGNSKQAEPHGVEVVVRKESKGGRDRKHEVLQMLPAEDVAEAIAACAIALPPLEALKIDDNELFGEEDSDQPALVGDKGEDKAAAGGAGQERAKANCNRASPPLLLKGEPRSTVSDEEIPLELEVPLTAAAAHDEFYDFGAKYEMMDFVQALPPLDEQEAPMKKKKDTSTAPPPVEAEERTLISFESPLQEKAPGGAEPKREQDDQQQQQQQQQLPDQRHQVAEQMQNVLQGGNILLAMCSSLREGSPAVATAVVAATAKKKASLETQEYEHLEYGSHEPEPDGRCAANVQPNAESAPSSIATATDIGRRRRKHKKDNTNPVDAIQLPTTSSSSRAPPGGKAGDGGNNNEDAEECEDDEEEEEEEEEEEDEEEEEEEEEEGPTVERAGRDEAEDEELQPLISSNKTSSSSLSGTTSGAQCKPEADVAIRTSGQEYTGPVSGTRQQQQQQQQQQEACDDVEEIGVATETMDTDGSLMNAAHTSSSSSPSQQSTALPSNIGEAETSAPATTAPATKMGAGSSQQQQQQQRATVAPGGAGHGGFGSGGNGNGKKKSKKKRK